MLSTDDDSRLPDDAAPGASLDDEIEGAVNLRSIGPLPAGPLRLRRRLLFRSGMTHQITPRGLERLTRGYGLRTVIDLRTAEELEKMGVAPFAAAGIAHHHAPMEDPYDRDPAARHERIRLFRAGAWRWSDVYRRIACASGPSLRQAFELIAGGAELPAIVHCAAGRDRTGVTVALLLSCLGVEREAIAEEYARSGPCLVRQVERFFRPSRTPDGGLTRDEACRVLATDGADLLRFLADLESAHGSIAAWLASVGIGDEVVAALRARLLE